MKKLLLVTSLLLLNLVKAVEDRDYPLIEAFKKYDRGGGSFMREDSESLLGTMVVNRGPIDDKTRDWTSVINEFGIKLDEIVNNGEVDRKLALIQEQGRKQSLECSNMVDRGHFLLATIEHDVICLKIYTLLGRGLKVELSDTRLIDEPLMNFTYFGPKKSCRNVADEIMAFLKKVYPYEQPAVDKVPNAEKVTSSTLAVFNATVNDLFTNYSRDKLISTLSEFGSKTLSMLTSCAPKIPSVFTWNMFTSKTPKNSSFSRRSSTVNQNQKSGERVTLNEGYVSSLFHKNAMRAGQAAFITSAWIAVPYIVYLAKNSVNNVL